MERDAKINVMTAVARSWAFGLGDLVLGLWSLVLGLWSWVLGLPSAFSSRPSSPCLLPSFSAAFLLVLLFAVGVAPAAELLDGEFGDINLGRKLIEPARFPTIRELRAAAAQPEMRAVLTLKLFGSAANHHLPIYSPDGRRLAFQRSDVKAKTSQLLLFGSLGQPEPQLLSNEAAYDYMFSWCEGSPSSYAFVRLAADRNSAALLVSEDEGPPETRTATDARRQFPALHRRTDGTWRLLFEQDGRVMYQSWSERGAQRAVSIANGTAPRWSSDGTRVIYARQRRGDRETASYDIVVRTWQTEAEQLLPAGEVGAVRSPVFAPDDAWAAFHLRAAGEGQPWRIRVCSADGRTGRTIKAEAVVNQDFDSAGPTWEPSGRRVWFFSPAHRQGAYFPLVAAEVETGRLLTVDYPRCCTTPNDLTINRAGAVPEMAFVGHDGLPQDVYVVFLNHF